MSYPTKASFTFNHADQATYPSTTPAEQKTNFDKRSEEMRVALNAVTAMLNAVTDGASGADSLGMTAISALGVSATVQSIVEALVTQLQATSADASGAEFIGAETISGLTGNDVQTLLEALSSALTTHKTSTDHDGKYFTESELGATTDGSSGADKIGATAISGLSGATVQALLEALKTAIDNAVLGSIADGSLTDAKLSDAAGQIKATTTTHATTAASSSVLGHVKEGTGVDIDEDGVLSLEADIARFKKGSSSFTDDDTEQTFTDAFCTADSLVTVSITSATTPQGVWSVESAAGEFTITSTVAESADITFDYFIQKVV